MSNYFAGLDWASQIHALCVIDERGSVVERCEIAHDAAGLAELKRRLRRWGSPPVAIERPSGLLVDALIEAGFTVVPIHPNAVKATPPALPQPRRQERRLATPICWPTCCAPTAIASSPWRRRATRSGRCSALGARARRPGGHPRAAGQPAAQPAGVVLAGRGSGLRRHRLADRAWPSSSATPRPSPPGALGPKRMAAFCAQHAYCGRRSAEELLARLHEAPAAVCAELEMEAKGELARSLARTLQPPGRADSAACPAASSTTSPRSRTASIIMSFPRAGRICAAQILAELGSVRERFVSDRAPRRRGRRRARHLRIGQDPRRSPSAGPAITACALPSPAWPTTPATPTPGPPASTPRPRPAAATTRTPFASSPVPGCASSGAPGTIAKPTTRLNTAPLNSSSKQQGVDTGCLMTDQPFALLQLLQQQLGQRQDDEGDEEQHQAEVDQRRLVQARRRPRRTRWRAPR